MSYADYHLCSMRGCDAKVFYDAEVDYREGTKTAALCVDHTKTHWLVVIPKDEDPTPWLLPGGDRISEGSMSLFSREITRDAIFAPRINCLPDDVRSGS